MVVVIVFVFLVGIWIEEMGERLYVFDRSGVGDLSMMIMNVSK